jgi:DNA-binding NtrC family response regulator
MSDVPLLAAHFLRMHGGSRDVQLTPAALEALMSNAWPGNVRELENALLLALALTSGDTIDVVSLPALVMAARDRSSVPEEPRGDLAWAQELSLTDAKKRASEDFERRYVTNALARAHGNLTEAARISGLDRSNFRRVLTRLGIDVGAFRDN